MNLPNPSIILEPILYKPKLLLFVSFDLVGSSLFKSNLRNQWQNSFFAFFERTYNEMKKFNCSSNLFKTWKLQGDEILFSLKIETLQDVAESVSHIYLTLLKISQELPHELDVKASAWLAYIDDELNKEIPEDFLGSLKKDYIGSTIDEGFRISAHFCQAKRFALSFDLVFILAQTEAIQYILCVGHQKLKGIWNHRYYPVFWYSENYSSDVENTPYDMEYECIFTDSFLHQKQFVQYDHLTKILKELSRSNNHLRVKHLEKIKKHLSI
ncbi:MAG: hypothetical protein ACI86H_001208 [bacterium]|jgi:hypothetical protein